MGRKARGTTRFSGANTSNTASAAIDLARFQTGQLYGRLVAEKTKDDRLRTWNTWNEFLRIYYPAASPDLCGKIWQWLAGDCIDDKNLAAGYCKQFLRYFVDLSVQEVIVWGSEERRSRQQITCVTSVNNTWKTLIAAAQEQVLDKLALQTGRQLVIARQQGPRGAADDGISARITRWIGTVLKEDCNLTIDSEYEKVPATCKDMELLLRALWARADDIPMSADNRVTMHIYLLILYVSGCRPGMLKDILWKHLRLYLISDPDSHSGRRLFLDPVLLFNKLKADSVLLSSERRKFKFSAGLMPTLLLDMTHMIVVWAVHKGALAHDFPSITAMLQKPHLDSGPTTFQWKEDIKDKRPFTMSCDTFRRHFKRLCLVAGLQSPPKPYFLRIGAGENLEDTGIPMSTISRIIGHTPSVHNKSYQSGRVRFDLQRAAFGNLAGDSRQLFQDLSHAWKDFDAKAPIYMTRAQKEEMNSRRDITEHEKRISEMKNNGATSAQISTERERLAQLRRRLEELAILARRDEYFMNKTTSKLMGTQPPNEQLEEELPWPRRHEKLDVNSLLRAWESSTVLDANAEARFLAATTWLGHFLAGTVSEIRMDKNVAENLRAQPHSKSSSVITSSSAATQQPDDGPEDHTITQLLSIPKGKSSKCVICYKSFKRRADLTKHYTLAHLSVLQRIFACPICQAATSSPSEFSNHVEREHGKQYAPHFTTKPSFFLGPIKTSIVSQVVCCICSTHVKAHDFFPKHFNRRHATEARIKKHEFECCECADVQKLDIDGWVDHLAINHGLPEAKRCPFCDRFFQPHGLAPHIQRSHFRQGQTSPMSCPICEELNGLVIPLQDYASWRVHALAFKHGIDTSHQSTVLSDSTGKCKLEGSDLTAPTHASIPQDTLEGASSTWGIQSLYCKDVIEFGHGPIDNTLPTLPKADQPNEPRSCRSSPPNLTNLDHDLVDAIIWQRSNKSLLATTNKTTHAEKYPRRQSMQMLLLDVNTGQREPQSLTGSTVCESPFITPGSPTLNCHTAPLPTSFSQHSSEPHPQERECMALPVLPALPFDGRTERSQQPPSGKTNTAMGYKRKRDSQEHLAEPPFTKKTRMTKKHIVSPVPRVTRARHRKLSGPQDQAANLPLAKERSTQHSGTRRSARLQHTLCIPCVPTSE
ncbi:hypothetical protein BD289DRAFT_439153 [Coniella lustricola]|uniref:C2H2-type domain-containing protein n=1 Tax=Coniella lustricola TaxID=2025994 RepID=A0A2T3A227_9PEZI|nr:hypothetical protein BD289DRAFT_439153 [Coniella lustricola]